MDNVWIVVADRSGASFFRRNRPSKGIQLFREIDHPEGRLKGHDIVSDRPGRTFRGRVTDVQKSGYTSHVTPQEHVAQEFAKELAEIVEVAKDQHEFRHLILVAGPTFLGQLRERLKSAFRPSRFSPQHDAKFETVDKNLGRINARDLSHHLTDVFDRLDRNPRLGRAA